MNNLPLQFRDGHLFVEVSGKLWLLDTGAPNSFGNVASLVFAGEQFKIGSSYMGLTAAKLADYIAVPCVGLLGADVLGRFDFIFDVPAGTVTASKEELSLSGSPVPLAEFMGIPIVTAQIAGKNLRMFFDTGAKIFYLQDDCLDEFPAAGKVTDFYPGFGQFQTDTHTVDVQIGTSSFSVQCGSLPDLLGMTLMMASTQGIIGNEILRNSRVGYFPRRRQLVLL